MFPCAAGDVREALAASATATQAKQQGVEARAALMAAEAVVAKLRQAAEACQADIQQAAKAFNLCNAAADGFQKATVSSTASEAAQVRLCIKLAAQSASAWWLSAGRVLCLRYCRQLSKHLAEGGRSHCSADTCRARSPCKLCPDYFRDTGCRCRQAVSSAA